MEYEYVWAVEDNRNGLGPWMQIVGIHGDTDRPKRPYVDQETIDLYNSYLRKSKIKYYSRFYRIDNPELFDQLLCIRDNYIKQHFQKSIEMSPYALLHQPRNKYKESFYYKRVIIDSHEDRKGRRHLTVDEYNKFCEIMKPLSELSVVYSDEKGHLKRYKLLEELENQVEEERKSSQNINYNVDKGVCYEKDTVYKNS